MIISLSVIMTLYGLIMLTEVEPFLTKVSVLLLLPRFFIMCLCCRVLDFDTKEGTLVTSWAFAVPGVLQDDRMSFFFRETVPFHMLVFNSNTIMHDV